MASETAKPTTVVPPPDAPKSASVGPYRIIGRLGKGGMAEVLLALQHDKEHDFKRLVVVKRVLSELENDDQQFISMFLDEARLAARLSHANVVQTYGVGQEGGSPYIAMEFLDGQSLNVVQRRAHAKGELVPTTVALKIISDALAGLHYAHELADFDGKPLGIIHRDVTPSNVFVKYDGTTKLVDFGIAKSATQREKTRAGVLKGKMAYMAPEQLRDETITRAADVWAVGIVLWETLADERLFRGKNDFETVQAIMKRDVPKLSERRSDVPAALDDVIRAAIERNPTKRIQTAEELRNRLEDVAFQLHKPLRANDVASVMREFFGDAVEKNRNLVKDFLEKPASFENEYLRFSTTGALEVRAESPSNPGSPGSSESSAPSATLVQPKPGKTAVGKRSAAQAAASQDDDKTTVDSAPAALAKMEAAMSRRSIPARAPQVAKSVAPPAAPETSQELAEDEEPPRPAWHWVVLALALLAVGGAIWYLLAT